MALVAGSRDPYTEVTTGGVPRARRDRLGFHINPHYLRFDGAEEVENSQAQPELSLDGAESVLVVSPRPGEVDRAVLTSLEHGPAPTVGLHVTVEVAGYVDDALDGETVES